jgi:fermentation-respiration switch protein FrsA (DUF1100 family)
MPIDCLFVKLSRHPLVARFLSFTLYHGIIVCGVGGVLLLGWIETQLVFPAPVYPAGDWTPEFEYLDVEFVSDDGTRLHGWLLPHPRPTNWILYCHGNGTHVAYTASGLCRLRDLLQASIFVFDYRGYGRSSGRPDERGVRADGAAAYRWLAERSGKEFSQLLLIGRSLGGAVALDLASNYGARGLILERTFTRLTDVAAANFPFLPVRLVMRNRFDNLTLIDKYTGPILQSHGTHDELVPLVQARNLFNASPSRDKRLFVMEGGNHNSPSPPEYEQALCEFVLRLQD